MAEQLFYTNFLHIFLSGILLFWVLLLGQWGERFFGVASDRSLFFIFKLFVKKDRADAPLLALGMLGVFCLLFFLCTLLFASNKPVWTPFSNVQLQLEITIWNIMIIYTLAIFGWQVLSQRNGEDDQFQLVQNTLNIILFKIPLFLAVFSLVFSYRTASVSTIVVLQSVDLKSWGVVSNPLSFVIIFLCLLFDVLAFSSRFQSLRSRMGASAMIVQKFTFSSLVLFISVFTVTFFLAGFSIPAASNHQVITALAILGKLTLISGLVYVFVGTMWQMTQRRINQFWCGLALISAVNFVFALLIGES